jgi:hypothetical protein
MNLEELTEKINDEKAHLDHVLAVTTHIVKALPDDCSIKVRWCNEYEDYTLHLYKADTYLTEIEIWDSSLTVWQGDTPHHIVQDSLIDTLQELGIIN